MRKSVFSFLSLFLAPFVASAANEGVPSYYQTQRAINANQTGYNQYASQGYTKYVGSSGNAQVVGSRTYSYQVPRQSQMYLPQYGGAMTTNGIAVPVESEPATSVYAGYARRFADFQFETGVNSILEWDDMILNEITVGARHNFSLRDFDLSAYGEYSHGEISHGGLSMDYDLKPFADSDPTYGIFTISMGDLSGRSEHFRFGLSAHHAWDIAGWKLSPTIGYEIFKHNLEMSDHYYPNPGIYLPLMTNMGDYVYGSETGEYFSIPVNGEVPEGLYQVCMSPEDIKLVQASGSGYGSLGTDLGVVDYDPAMGYIPWGVDAGECVMIGGDGPVLVSGTTHIYNTTWSGFYVGLEVEKQMTLNDKLRMYVQFGLPKYSSEGIWPNRTDWQQNPSFIDEGDNGSYSYQAEIEYNYKLSDRVQLAIRADTNCFHVGEIPGELYVAGSYDYVYNDDGTIQTDDNGNPLIQEIAPYTEYVSNSLKKATWQSFGLYIGVKYSF